MRVTDAIVRQCLVWARNYEEIREFTMIAKAGRKWRVRLAGPVVIGSGLFVNRADPAGIVPAELVLTSREALAFAYGCAVGGAAHGRAEFARRKWDW